MKNKTGFVTEIEVTNDTTYAQIVLDGENKKGQFFRYSQSDKDSGTKIYSLLLASFLNGQKVKLSYADDTKNGFKGIIKKVKIVKS